MSKDSTAGRTGDGTSPGIPGRDAGAAPFAEDAIPWRAVAEAAPDAIVIADADGVMRLVNAAAERLFGYPRDALLGRPVELLVPAALRERHVGQRRRYVESPHSRPMGIGLEITGVRSDGAEIPVEISLSPLATPAGPMVISFIRDIAERKRFEQARRERDFMRAEQLNATAQVAAGVAHELRNPLTGIKGLVQVLKRECDAIGHPTAGEDLQIIEQEIRRMEKTLQTFLDFARPPKPSRRRIRPAELVERTFALVGGRAAKQRVSLEFAPPAGDPIEVEADPDQVHQLLVNLALNALDVMPQGGRFAVELSRGRDGVILRTTDTGPGIPPALLPKLFRPFVSGKETGIGLGLAVSRRIAEDHGGSLTADNRPGPDGRPAGAVFTLTLPLHAPADPGIPSAARTPPMSDR